MIVDDSITLADIGVVDSWNKLDIGNALKICGIRNELNL
jgi:hypothetical protein